MTRKAKRRRASQPESAVLPWWQRIAAAVSFTVGGGGCAAWGIHDIVVLIGALKRSAAMIETQSAMPGLPLLGIGIGAIGPLFLLPQATTLRWQGFQEKIAVAILVLMAVGCVMSLAGGIIVDAVMAQSGYRSCEVTHGRRMTFVVWAAPGAACPVTKADRPPV